MADYNKKYYIRYKSTTSATPNITAWSDWTPANSKTCSSKLSSLNGASSPQLIYGFDPDWQGDPLPSNSIIRGIKVYFTRAAEEASSTNFVVDNYVKINLSVGGNSSDKSDISTKWPLYIGGGSFQQVIYGGSSDTWGFSSSQLAGSNFNESFEFRVGVAMTCNRLNFSAYAQAEPYPSDAYTVSVILYYDIITPPTVTTKTPYNIDFTQARSGGENAHSDDDSMTDVGIQYREAPSGTIITKSLGWDAVNYSVEMDGLTQGTGYLVRAYATDNNGTGYGSWLSFTTLTNRPEVQTTGPTDINPNYVYGGIHIIDSHGTLITKGVLRHTYPSIPTITDYQDIQQEATSDPSDKSYYMSGLYPGTQYYIRAFATNANGIGYGLPVLFTTTTNVPTLSTRDPDLYPFLITSTSAQSGGYNITANGTLSEVGVCWNGTGNPTIADNHEGISTTSASNFLLIFSGLMAGTFYFVRAYAINGSGVGYGDEQTFFTLAGTAPVVTTKNATSISADQALVGGNITLNGNTFIQEGIEYWETATGNGGRVAMGSFISDFTLWLTSLNSGTNYGYYAYVQTNEFGETQGSTKYFTTSSVSYPVVQTYPPDYITSNSARSGGFSIQMNGQTLISKNLNYRKMSGGPIIRLTDPNVNTDNYHLTMTSLDPATTYECYAYLETGIGGFYGEHLEFTTSALPTGIVKRWNGSVWSLVTPKKWNGASWQDAVTKWWTGSAWSDHH